MAKSGMDPWTTKISEIEALRSRLKTWRKVAEHYPGIKPGTLCSIVKNGYRPKRRDILKALGMDAICPCCGQIIRE